MSRTTGSKGMWIAALRADGAEFRAAAADTDPLTDVPSCPGWNVASLVHHLGSVYRYVNTLIIRGVTTPPERVAKSFFDETPAPDLLGWFDEQLGRMADTLDVIDPEMPAWNWAPQAKRAGFWHRRLAHETAVHRWDVQMTAGIAEPIEAPLAADGVAEVLDTWLPAGRRFPPMESGIAPSAAFSPVNAHGIVALMVTDVEHVWTVRLRGEGIALLDTETIFDDDEYPARAVASGNASDIELALWGRVGFDVLEITGDEPLLTALRVG